MFLPVNLGELNDRGFEVADFVVVSGDAYVDHPTFGHAIIARFLEAEGFSVGIIPQPVLDADFMAFGAPTKAFLISGGVVDSMVNNYTVSKKKREKDVYSEGGRRGKRPDRAVDVYAKKLRSLYPDVPIIIGGIEASLRRLSHYDYWDDNVRHSILLTSGADLLVYGMGEYPLLELSKYAHKNVPLSNVKNINGTAYLTTIASAPEAVRQAIQANAGANDDFIILASHERVTNDKVAYSKAFIAAKEQGEYPKTSVLIQKQDYEHYVVVNPPSPPIGERLMDKTYALPFMRRPHPMYKDGVPAILEVEFSVTAHRGCFGDCSFCALIYHQGRMIDARSTDSIIREVEQLTTSPDFKGYIHDIGGPSANFHQPACNKQGDKGSCTNRSCAGFKQCPNLSVSHKKFMDVLRRARSVKGVKKVFVRSGIRYDYIMADQDKTVLPELIEHHISGQLKVAPEHCSNNVLKMMNKPAFENYLAFAREFERVNKLKGKKQFLVPYFISSHPGCTIKDAIKLTEYLKSIGYMPLQVQDFYPTPSTLSTTIYYTGMNPCTLEPVYTAKTAHEKAMQRALLQYRLPQNKRLIEEAYRIAAQQKDERNYDARRASEKNISKHEGKKARSHNRNDIDKYTGKTTGKNTGNRSSKSVVKSTKKGAQKQRRNDEKRR